MAHAFIMEFDGSTLDQYDAIIADMQLGGRLPEGALFHACGKTETGTVVADIWESAERYSTFAQERIGPLSAKHGVPEPRVRDFEVDEIREGAHGPVGLLQLVTLRGLDHDGFATLDRQITGGAVPEGLVYFACGPVGEDWMIVDYWTSQEAHDTFIAEHVRPVMESTGRDAPDVFEVIAVHNALTEAAVPH